MVLLIQFYMKKTDQKSFNCILFIKPAYSAHFPRLGTAGHVDTRTQTKGAHITQNRDGSDKLKLLRLFQITAPKYIKYCLNGKTVFRFIGRKYSFSFSLTMSYNNGAQKTSFESSFIQIFTI